MTRALTLLLILLLAACAQSDESCKLTQIARLPLLAQNHLLSVPIGINGHWVRLIVDSGAERTTLSEEAVARLGLPSDARHITRSVGVGGASLHADARLDSMVLGGVRFPVERLAVGRLNLTSNGLNADGLLGADILLAFELDIDVPDQTLTLYRVRRCADAQPNWRHPAVEVTGVTARKDRMLIPFTLDGTAGKAILDTGAQLTVIGMPMAQRLGLTAESMAGDPVMRHLGAGPNAMAAHVHRFRELRIGPAVVESPALSVLPTDTGIGDALIGEDFLQGRRVWMSFPTQRFFVSPLPHEVAAAK